MPVLISDQAYESARALACRIVGGASNRGWETATTHAEDLLFHLKTAETIDSAGVKDVIEYAQKSARESNGSTAAGIAEKSERLRASLAMVSMNPKAVDRIGEADE